MEAVRDVPPAMVISNADAVLPLLSVTVNVTLYVPLTAKLVVKLEEVPVEGLPPDTAHAYV
jgi:hypothetical protein